MFVVRTDTSPVSIESTERSQQDDMSKGSFKTKLSDQQGQKEEREEQSKQAEKKQRRDNPHETAVSVDASDEYAGASDEEERVNPSLRGWDLGATYDRAKKRLAQALEGF